MLVSRWALRPLRRALCAAWQQSALLPRPGKLLYLRRAADESQGLRKTPELSVGAVGDG